MLGIPVRCNRCGRIVEKFHIRKQNKRGFSAFFCDEPEWGFDCWEKVQQMLAR